MVLSCPNNGSDDGELSDPHRLSEDLDSSCSTPFVSAPSSPTRNSPSGYFFSAPASPMHHFLMSSGNEHHATCSAPEAAANLLTALESSGSFEFEFSSRFSPTGSNGNPGLMSSADELFLNGQIRPMKLSAHLQRPQIPGPFMDLDEEAAQEELAWSMNGGGCSDHFSRGRDLRARNKSMHRKARSLSPLRTGELNWHEKACKDEEILEINEEISGGKDIETAETTPSCSASSSRSSSSGRNSKKWIFLKDLLHRSKSEGRGNSRERFWSTISFSPAKEEKEKRMKKKGSKQRLGKKSEAAAGGKPVNGLSKRRVGLSAHELHYTKNRAQAEEMKKKTYLPYRQGLLGCLGFNSKGYTALTGFTKSLNPISSR